MPQDETPDTHHPAAASSQTEDLHGIIYKVLCPRCGREGATRTPGLYRCTCGTPITIDE